MGLQGLWVLGFRVVGLKVTGLGLGFGFLGVLGCLLRLYRSAWLELCFLGRFSGNNRVPAGSRVVVVFVFWFRFVGMCLHVCANVGVRFKVLGLVAVQPAAFARLE